MIINFLDLLGEKNSLFVNAMHARFAEDRYKGDGAGFAED
jgi:hypothetical protein